jgi:hypothetical protein
MKSLINYYFLNYYDFSLRGDGVHGLALSKALNLIILNLIIMTFTATVLLMKSTQQLGGPVPRVISRGISFF